MFLALSPLLARAYDPADFGLLAVFLALTCIDVIACGGYERAVFLPESEADAVRVGCVAALCCVLVGSVATAAVFVAGAFGRWSLVSANAGWLPWAVGGAIFAAGLLQTMTATVLRQNRYGFVAAARSLQLPVAAVCQLGLGTAGLGASGLIVGHILGMTTGVVVLMAGCGRLLPTLRLTRLPAMMAVAWTYRNFPRYSLVGNGLNSASLQLPPATLVALFGSVSGGSFNFGFRLAGAGVNTISQAAGQALISLLSREMREGRRSDEMDRILRTMAALLACVTLPFVVLLLLAPGIFEFAFGPPWYQAGQLLSLMAPMIVSQLLITPFHGVLDLLGRQDIHFKREMIRAVLLSITFGLVFSLGLSLVQTVMLVAVAGSTSYLWGAAQIWSIYRKHRGGP